MLKFFSLATWGAAVLLLSSLTSCEDILEQYFPKPTPTPPTIPAQTVAYTSYADAVTPGSGDGAWQNGLIIFNPITLAKIQEMPITGLSAVTDRIYGLDIRPATGQLYALVATTSATDGRLYTINPATGAATLVAPVSIPLSGSLTLGFDFNPVVDRIRIVTKSGQNLRVNPVDGVAIEDGRINGGTANSVMSVAYDNNVAGATSTNLYALDFTASKLYLVNPPNAGTLTEIGSLSINFLSDGSFDIGATSKKAYAVMSGPYVGRLYSINLTTGAATELGDFGFPAIRPSPTPGFVFAPFITGFTLGLAL
ncbi:DUF4394 domain-containing protein [Hymenobacter radiodurans]|uniref:DUF4394 domain-containing protein n=1 Tax=Hymenobacter radiodurans TaxID=2496028 RepID=UPI001058D3FA|nr:DUF4394 domain-containing protein [Hymenobacter radiodurans]